MIKRLLLLAATVTAMVLGPGVAADAAATGSAATGAAQSVQQKVDAVMAAIPGGRQTSPTRVQYDGLTVTVSSAETSARALALSCGFGHLCMTVRGTNFDFYYCRTWTVSNWYGTGPFVNNQTPGTVARFYGQQGQQLWTSTAYQSGVANWGPVWSLRNC